MTYSRQPGTEVALLSKDMKHKYWVQVAEAILAEPHLSIAVMVHYFETYPQFYKQLNAMFRELAQPPSCSWKENWLKLNP